MNRNPPAKPWIVKKIHTAKDNRYYPWHVELENHYFEPTEPGFHCFWNTAIDDPRFDLSGVLVS